MENLHFADRCWRDRMVFSAYYQDSQRTVVFVLIFSILIHVLWRNYLVMKVLAVSPSFVWCKDKLFLIFYFEFEKICYFLYLEMTGKRNVAQYFQKAK